MSYKNAATTTVTRDLLKYEKGTGNIYESLVVISKRANHIGAELKEELQNKLDLAHHVIQEKEETIQAFLDELEKIEFIVERADREDIDNISEERDFNKIPTKYDDFFEKFKSRILFFIDNYREV